MMRCLYSWKERKNVRGPWQDDLASFKVAPMSCCLGNRFFCGRIHSLTSIRPSVVRGPARFVTPDAPTLPRSKLNENRPGTKKYKSLKTATEGHREFASGFRRTLTTNVPPRMSPCSLPKGSTIEATTTSASEIGPVLRMPTRVLSCSPTATRPGGGTTKLNTRESSEFPFSLSAIISGTGYRKGELELGRDVVPLVSPKRFQRRQQEDCDPLLGRRVTVV